MENAIFVSVCTRARHECGFSARARAGSTLETIKSVGDDRDVSR